MRAALEAVAEFLTKCGALEDSGALVATLETMGHTVPDTSPLHWRLVIAGMKRELGNRNTPVDYVFIYERLVQLYVMIPKDLCKELFTSPLIFHILVERFANAFQGFDAELFKLESDVLCHSEGVYDMCQLIQNKLYANEETSEEPSRLSTFLEAFSGIFREDEPLEAWIAFHTQHCINDASFRRDMKRALSVIEDATLGPTQIELKFPEPESSEPSNKVVSRELIEARFRGEPKVWSDLSVVNTVAVAKPSSAAATGRADDSIEEIDNDEAEDRVWSSRLPIAVDEAEYDSSPSATPSARAVAADDAGTSPVSRGSSPAPTAPATTTAARASPRPQTQQQQRTGTTAAGARAADPPLGLRHRGKRKRWSNEEVDALLKGHREFEAHPNIWVMIQNKYNPILRERTNVDLKDKYRNLLKYNKIPRPSV